MHTFFSLQIISHPHQASYQHSAFDWVRKVVPEVVRFDMDSLSDGLTLQYAGDLLRQSEKAVLMVEVKDAAAAASKLLPFLEQFIAHSQAFAILPGPEHPLVTRMLNLLPPERIQRPDEWSASRHFMLTWLQQ
jgi:hypothetical protein